MAIGESFPETGGQTRRMEFDTLRARLMTERSTFDSHWRELGEYFMPRRPRFLITDKNKGDKRSQQLVDSTPRFSARTLQSGLQAGLTSPARPWLRLTTPDSRLAEEPAVKLWLHEVTGRLLSVFAKTNLYNALPVLYGDLGVFGTAALGIMEDHQDLFRCYVYPVGSYALDVDQRGLPSHFVREYEMTVDQLVDQFGYPEGRDPRTGPDWRLFSESTKNSYEQKKRQDKVEVCWMVTRNAPEDMKGNTPWPYLSVHFEKAVKGEPFKAAAGGGQKLLRESGFWEFPVLIPRWDVTGNDAYGTDCPGMTALGDSKQLQSMQRRKGQAVEKMVNPPLVGPSNLRTQKTSLLPGDITYADVREGLQGLRPIHDTNVRVDQLTADIRETQFRIQRSFYEDLFLMLAASDASRGAQPVTAREVEERHEEKLLALGPVLERTNDELLDPLVDRVYAIMDRGGLIPPPPPQLEGVDLRVEYISLMSQAQKLVGVVAQDRFLASVAGMAQTFPEVVTKINTMQAVNDYAEQIGVNPELVLSNEQAQAKIDQANQQAAAAQAAAVAKDAAAAGVDVAAAQGAQEENAAVRRTLGAPR